MMSSIRLRGLSGAHYAFIYLICLLLVLVKSEVTYPHVHVTLITPIPLASKPFVHKQFNSLVVLESRLSTSTANTDVVLISKTSRIQW